MLRKEQWKCNFLKFWQTDQTTNSHKGSMLLFEHFLITQYQLINYSLDCTVFCSEIWQDQQVVRFFILLYFKQSLVSEIHELICKSSGICAQINKSPNIDVAPCYSCDDRRSYGRCEDVWKEVRENYPQSFQEKLLYII